MYFLHTLWMKSFVFRNPEIEPPVHVEREGLLRRRTSSKVSGRLPPLHTFSTLPLLRFFGLFIFIFIFYFTLLIPLQLPVQLLLLLLFHPIECLCPSFCSTLSMHPKYLNVLFLFGFLLFLTLGILLKHWSFCFLCPLFISQLFPIKRHWVQMSFPNLYLFSARNGSRSDRSSVGIYCLYIRSIRTQPTSLY